VGGYHGWNGWFEDLHTSSVILKMLPSSNLTMRVIAKRIQTSSVLFNDEGM
jgi:hypothetical protein